MEHLRHRYSKIPSKFRTRGRLLIYFLHSQIFYTGEAVLRNTCANGILVNKSTKYNWFLKGHDTTDNECREPQLIIHLHASKKR